MNLAKVTNDSVFPSSLVSCHVQSFKYRPDYNVGIAHINQTYCERSSIRVCKLLFRTQDKLRSVHLLQGGPLSLITHLICFKISSFIAILGACRTFCLRHDAHAVTFRDTSGAEASTVAFDSRGREAGDVDGFPSSTWDQDRFGGMTGGALAITQLESRCCKDPKDIIVLSSTT
jgi:hypothetical protein